ncbi:ARGININE DEMETHYLASE AND LYSYL-HYDROXYLASE JMJD [Salix koriyanagi]|uniref:ARGININE DEMETHYLASE AND LYSYL-HYDROXYLASE JMJD n=1 Tax=Salix koriyanagi TaxID=2511006 RepID=A0A9Q1APK0_9ROSI|nr:ARGININE DEMETHYLASE AND LYSYL-HYDROXYLASE JMJD [Salix koriyanagi]
MNLLSRTIKKKRHKKPKTKTRNKRQETKEDPVEQDELGEDTEGFNLKTSAPSNTYGVQPLGNLYFSSGSINSRNTGLGNLQILTDELVLDILGFLDGTQLGVLATVSKSFYVFTNHEPLWRNLVLDKLNGEFLFNGSWKSTYIAGIYPLFDVNGCSSLKEPNRPVLLEGCIDNWAALQKWDKDYLVSVCGDVKFAAGPVEMRLQEYFRYSDQVREERPLYLFDPKFAEKVPVLDSEYEVPLYFREDLFSVLGNERPDYRWVIIGPAGSGSSFHIDPNSTSAWNAVIKGSKKWVLFPPDVIPPGVYPSPDGAEVACPVSIIEWFMNFYGATKNLKRRPIECICKAGEVIFVPNGWWHLVINLEESIAITQNYVSRRNLLNVLDFLKRPNAGELVSGTRDRVNLHDKFENAVESTFPGTIDRLVQKAEEKRAQEKKPSFWDSVTDSHAGAFKFSF